VTRTDLSNNCRTKRCTGLESMVAPAGESERSAEFAADGAATRVNLQMSIALFATSFVG
jgi:hypothetical protein